MRLSMLRARHTTCMPCVALQENLRIEAAGNRSLGRDVASCLLEPSYVVGIDVIVVVVMLHCPKKVPASKMSDTVPLLSSILQFFKKKRKKKRRGCLANLCKAAKFDFFPMEILFIQCNLITVVAIAKRTELALTRTRVAS